MARCVTFFDLNGSEIKIFRDNKNGRERYVITVLKQGSETPCVIEMSRPLAEICLNAQDDALDPES